MSVQTLTIKVGGDISEALDGLNKLGERAQRAGRDLARTGRTLSRNLTAPLAAVGAAAAAAGLKVGNMADKILDLEQQTGLSTTAIQEFRRAATVAGVDQDTVADAAERLTRRLKAAGEQSASVKEAFRQLGVQSRNADGSLRSMDDLMPDLITSLQGVEDITTRNSLATEVFGRGASKIAPILGMTADEFQRAREEAHELGLVLGEDSLTSANEFRKELDTLKASAGAIADQVGIAVLPIMSDLATLFQERVLPMVRKAVEWLQNLDPTVVKVAAAVGALTASIGPVVFAGGKMIGMLGLIASPAGLAVAAIAALGTAATVVVQNWDILKMWGTTVWASIKIAVFDAVDGILGALERMGGIWPPLQRKIADLREGFNLFAEESLANTGRRIRELEQEVASNFNPTLNETAEAATNATTAVQGLGQAAMDIAEPVRELANSVSTTEGHLQEIAPTARESAEEAGSAMDTLKARAVAVGADGLESITNFATGAKAAIAGFVKSAIQQLAALVARFAIFKALTSAFDLTSGGLLGGSLFGFALPEAKAMGGPVTAGTPYIVGERGPELIVPSQSGTVIPNHAMTAAAPPPTFDFSRFPSARNPLESARDSEWMRFLTESAEQLKANGYDFNNRW